MTMAHVFQGSVNANNFLRTDDPGTKCDPAQAVTGISSGAHWSVPHTRDEESAPGTLQGALSGAKPEGIREKTGNDLDLYLPKRQAGQASTV